MFDVGSLLLTTADPSTNGGTSINPELAPSRWRPTSIPIPTPAWWCSRGATINVPVIVTGGIGNYVAMVSPVVQQFGTVTVNGVGRLCCRRGCHPDDQPGPVRHLLSVTTGSDTAPVEHDGTTQWESANTASINRRIYLVSVPKNNAITMLLSPTLLGFDVATQAHQGGDGTIYLTAGRDIDHSQANSLGRRGRRHRPLPTPM